MRVWSICVLLSLCCVGCNRAEEARRRELAQQNLKQLEMAVQNYHQSAIESTEGGAKGQQEKHLVSVSAEDASAIVEGGNRFALDLYGQLRSGDGNLFFSPSSISTALAMTLAGAAGETKTEMANTLHLNMPDPILHEGMKSVQAFWSSDDEESGIRLNLANRLWGQRSYEFLPGFLELTRDNYDAELARLDFAQSEAARETINSWVEEQTENKITELIPSGLLSADTRLVLTNAVYFYGSWTNPFDQDATRDEDFHVTADETTKVPMMYRKARYGYGETEEIQVLELPYGDGRLSMVVLLPREVDGLSQIEAGLNYENFQRWTAAAKRKREVKVYLPRFKTTSQIDLGTTLRAMGMDSPFDPDAADFSAMSGDRDLYLSAVVHKAFVDVNEEGTEAAAATGAIIATRSLPRAQPVFRADHPFVFVIRDNRNQAILFVGRVANPLE